MIKLNQSIKNRIISEAVKSKYRPLFEKARRELTIAGRNIAIANSLHNEAKKCSPELLRCINQTNRLSLSSDILIEKDIVGFALCDSSSKRICYTESFDDPVFAAKHCEVPKSTTEYITLVGVIKDAHDFYNTIRVVINSYSKAEKLFEDLPWTKDFYPDLPTKNTQLVDKRTIEQINSVMNPLVCRD